MQRRVIYFWVIVSSLFLSKAAMAEEEVKEEFSPKDMIFEHLGDEYGWHAWGKNIPLPIIVRDHAGSWHIFSSMRLEHGGSYEGFYIAATGANEGKVEGVDKAGNVYRPIDFSVTKNVLAVIISTLAMCATIFPLVRWYKKNRFKAPRRGLGFVEVIIHMLYQEVIVATLGKDAKRYAPYLLTLFFFILFSNLLGLMVVFPGGANVMGNISVTMALAICTFVVVNVSGTKEYWHEVFWPDVPLWLKVPIPIMPIIEIFGVLTKPVALMIRLFANILGGHLITLVLITLIFILGAMGEVIMGASTIFSVAFAVFMNLIDLLICFIQAYVFMMLSTIFIGLARVKK